MNDQEKHMYCTNKFIELANQLKAEEIDINLVNVIDNEQRPWWLVTSGEYDIKNARKASYELKRLYGINSAIIKLPADGDAEKKEAGKAPVNDNNPASSK